MAVAGNTDGVEPSLEPNGGVFSVKGRDGDVSDFILRVSERLAKDDVKGQFLRVSPEHSVWVDSSLLMIVSPSYLIEEFVIVYSVFDVNV